MYCPRCNLHSEEYVDKCPLCAGPMEVDEIGSGVFKSPTVPEKEPADGFLHEELIQFPDEEMSDDSELREPSDTAEFTPRKLRFEPEQELPDFGEWGEEPTKTPPPKEEYVFGQTERLYQQDIPPLPKRSGGKKLFSWVGGSIIFILLLVAAGWYFYFSQAEMPALLKKVTVALNKKTMPSRATPAPSPAPVAKKPKRMPKTTPPQPQEVTPALPSEKSALPLPEKTAAKTPTAKEELALPSADVKEPEAIPPEGKKPEAPLPAVKTEKAPAATTEAKKTTTPPPAPVEPAEPPKKATATTAAKSTSSVQAAPLPAFVAKGEYAIMVGSFKEKQNALTLKNKLQKKGYPVSYYAINLPGKGNWYRVVVGNYPDLSTAKKVASKLKNQENVPVLMMKGDKYI